jgi:hypothetical protein
VTWDQGANGNGPAMRRPLAATGPHLIEIAGPLDVTGFDHFPSLEDWFAFYDTICRGEVEALLGAPLDPLGWYQPSGIGPFT